MAKIRHVVFDIGNVLIHYDPQIPFRRLIPDDEERDRFLTEVCSQDWNAEQDRGRTWADAEAQLIAEHPDKAELIRAFRHNWSEMVPHAISESVQVLEDLLDAGVDVTALTNFADDTFDVARGDYPFLDRFRGVTVSARVELMKPDTAIYHHHRESFDLEPAATLFFDDKAENVAAARASGWHAELFEGPEKLRADLERYGVLPAARSSSAL